MNDCDICSTPDAKPVLDPWGGVRGYSCEECNDRAENRAGDDQGEAPEQPEHRHAKEQEAARKLK